ncbi:FAD/NAD(P)-binding domain-containing protein [Mycena venus]|uniref:FAD/NAD(P)-binding domain-containing protein n=1 Tax=Mycena venus TaxID=2733690 RepID=A0A8H6Y569_9AGAR|nr:FAD/NAD(P)-binding domain-containing protein [Mycena venus]
MSAPTADCRPLNIAIVGAGLGGLGAAIALRRQGHLVKVKLRVTIQDRQSIFTESFQVFEASLVNKEIGAAIGVPPNAMRVLEAFGYDQKNLRSCDYRGIVAYSADGGEGKTMLFKDQAKHYGRQGCLCHRTALHEELKRLALGEVGPGTPVQIFLGAEIVNCDPQIGTLTNQAGETYEADVIIGADGIRSTMRTVVLGSPVVPPATNICTFRWTVDASKLEGRPELDWVLKVGVPGGRMVGGAGSAHIFLYPCQDATLINVAMMHPDARDQDKHSWYSRVTREDVLKEYKDFGPPFKAFIQLAEDPINLWQMRAMPLLPTWTKGRLALLGDAAHATFPTLGQGAAMAVEDSAALGCMLPYGTKPEEVPSRLAAYQDVRKARDDFVCLDSLEQVTIPSKRGLFFRSGEMQDMLNGYDAIAVAREHFHKTFIKI